MSTTPHHTETKSKQGHHGTMTSYVAGFILSLLFTLIPYYLVVKKPTDKHTILATIIAFAVLQLVVQVVFFLHLGREKKPRWNLFFLTSTIGIILVVVLGSIWIMNHLHYNMMPMDVTDKVANDEMVHQINGKQTGTCPGGTGVNYKIELKNNMASPSHVDAHLCDTLTIMNMDDTERMIMFGVYGKNEMYAGEMGKTLRSGRNMVVTLTELGTHQFHDHMQQAVSGDFTVMP